MFQSFAFKWVTLYRYTPVKTHRALYRGRRAEAPVPVVSLVGYTNAGKSSLLNQLTAAGVLVGLALVTLFCSQNNK
jgi:50S ribosomal subunit-associated GTPase HflX